MDWFCLDDEEGEAEYARDMRYLVAYDISINKKRTNVARILAEYGDRVQESVFECFLNSYSREEMWQRLIEYIDEQDDRLRVIPICGSCEKKIEVAGGGERRPEEIEVFIV